jgi:predicted HD superfamily hydrolase involved in NAD metabolism
MSQLLCLPYVQAVGFSGVIRTDAQALLTANGKQAVAEHCAAVAETAVALAVRFGFDGVAAETAAILHDISGVVKPSDMLAYACQSEWELDEAESKYPFLLHQRVSRAIAAEDFGICDETVLSAIECHTTLKSDPSPQDMILFLADKLSWDQAGKPPFFDAVSEALNDSLYKAAYTYIDFVISSNMIQMPHKWLLEAKAWLENLISS